MNRAPKIQVVEASSLATMERKLRNPRHTFAVSQQPFEIRPFLLAPVLPGETLQHLNIQAQFQSGLLYQQMTGWWSEAFFFYVKHRDLAERDAFSQMHVTNYLDPALNVAPDPLHYHAVGVNWSKLCLRRVVEEYFRNEGEAWDEYLSPDGLPLASINIDDWMDSAIRDGSVDSADGDISAVEFFEESHHAAHEVMTGFEDHYAHWQVMRRMNLIQTDFEDYLRANGISVPEEDQNPHKPELLRYIRSFHKPRRALSSLGEEASKVEFEWKETADKARLFKEPGFIFGVSVVRPKMFRNLNGSAAGMLNDAFGWLPALMLDNPETSMRVVPAANFTALAGGYTGEEDVIFDVRDLLLYGDQYKAGEFADFLIGPLLAGPDANLNRRYATDPFPWFETAAADPPDTFALPPAAFVGEGVVSLAIKSRVHTDISGHGQSANPELGA